MLLKGIIRYLQHKKSSIQETYKCTIGNGNIHIRIRRDIVPKIYGNVPLSPPYRFTSTNY